MMHHDGRTRQGYARHTDQQCFGSHHRHGCCPFKQDPSERGNERGSRPIAPHETRLRHEADVEGLRDVRSWAWD